MDPRDLAFIPVTRIHGASSTPGEPARRSDPITVDPQEPTVNAIHRTDSAAPVPGLASGSVLSMESHRFG